MNLNIETAKNETKAISAKDNFNSTFALNKEGMTSFLSKLVLQTTENTFSNGNGDKNNSLTSLKTRVLRRGLSNKTLEIIIKRL